MGAAIETPRKAKKTAAMVNFIVTGVDRELRCRYYRQEKFGIDVASRPATKGVS